MITTEKYAKICGICFNKYQLYIRPRTLDYITYWYIPKTSGEIVKYDEYYDKITIATMVIVGEEKLIFCMHEKVDFEDFEQALDDLMLEYKKALVRLKVQELDKDFQV